jgi:hypothetical protein
MGSRSRRPFLTPRRQTASGKAPGLADRSPVGTANLTHAQLMEAQRLIDGSRAARMVARGLGIGRTKLFRQLKKLDASL